MLQQYDILMIYNVYMNNSNCRTPMIVIERLCNGYEYCDVNIHLYIINPRRTVNKFMKARCK